MATSRRVGNYATSAKAVTQASDQIFDSAMSGKPDFTAISREAIKGRGLERRAVIEAEGNVAKAGLEAFTKAKRTQNAADTAKEINNIKRPARRMAGVVAGLGAISGAALMHKNAKEDKAERDALRADQQAVWDLQTSMMDDLRAQSEALRTQISSLNNQTFPGATTPPKTNGSEPTNSGSTPAPSPSPSPSSSGTSLQLKPGGRVTQQQGVQLLIDAGMSPENARIGGAIMMAESAGDPGALNPNGEHSVGLWQHNRDTGEDRRGFYGIQNWDELRDPKTNARATVKLFNRRGGWEDWGAYTNGSYTQFLK